MILTEKEKMLRGELYDANYDKELIEERRRCKIKCQEYNTLPYDSDRRKELLSSILGSHGNEFTIEPSFWCDYGYNIHLGENFYSNHNLVILDGAMVRFGNNVFVAPNCGFYTAGHPINAEERNKGLEYARPITIGNDVWIGAGVQVMPGVTIGNNVVIGGGSVVVKNIPDNCVAVGNPCKVIKRIG